MSEENHEASGPVLCEGTRQEQGLKRSLLQEVDEAAYAGFKCSYLAASRRLVMEGVRLDEMDRDYSDYKPSIEVLADLKEYENVAARFLLESICAAINAGLRPDRMLTIVANAAAFVLEHEDDCLLPFEPKGMTLLEYPKVQYTWMDTSTSSVILVTPNEGVQVFQGEVEEVKATYGPC